jgi:hypothetical protein
MTIHKIHADLDWTNCVYVGRPHRFVPAHALGRDGRFANPFPVQGTSIEARFAAIEEFCSWVLSNDDRAQHLRRSLGQLQGRDLVCWCTPKRCHAEVLELLVAGAGHEELARYVADLHAELVPQTLFDL